MTFKPEGVVPFQETFEQFKSHIRNQPGCTHLELWQGHDHPNIFFTYSHWESKEHLEAYRNSETFKEVWPLTKMHFAAKPEAWSVDRRVAVSP